MFLSKIKVAATAAAVVLAVAAGAVALAQSGGGKPKDGAGKPRARLAGLYLSPAGLPRRRGPAQGRGRRAGRRLADPRRGAGGGSSPSSPGATSRPIAQGRPRPARRRPEASEGGGHQPQGDGPRRRPAVRLPAPRLAAHQRALVGGRDDPGGPRPRGPGGEEGRSDVHDRAGPGKPGSTPRRPSGISPSWSWTTPGRWPSRRSSARTS